MSVQQTFSRDCYIPAEYIVKVSAIEVPIGSLHTKVWTICSWPFPDLGEVFPPLLLFLLVLLLSRAPLLLTMKDSILNLITILQRRLRSWMPEKLKWNIQFDTVLFLSLLNNAFSMHSGQMRSDTPSTKLSIQLPRRTSTGAQASLQHINLLFRQGQLREKQQGKTQGSEAVSFMKAESWNFLQVVNFMAQFIFCKWVYSAVELQTCCAVKHAKFWGEQR